MGLHIGATWQMRLSDRAQGRNFIPPPVSDVATLPWEIQKSHFFTIIIHILHIIFVISEVKQIATVVLQL